METLQLSKTSLSDLKRLVNIHEGRTASHTWVHVDNIQLAEREQVSLHEITHRLLNETIHLMNEATIWSRAIYPLLILAERDSIRAWAGVFLEAQYAHFRLEGIADGALAESVMGRAETPYLVVVETNRGVDGQNPVSQLYAQLLAAAHLNWQQNGKSCQEMFGCYTIADSWTFLRAEVEGFDADMPHMRLEHSGEYSERLEAATILRILKGIVARFLDNA